MMGSRGGSAGGRSSLDGSAGEMLDNEMEAKIV